MRTLELLDVDSSGPDVLASFVDVDEVMGLRTACVCVSTVWRRFFTLKKRNCRFTD